MYACMHMHMHMYMHMYVYVYVCICIRWYVKAFVCTILQAGWNPLTGSAVQEHWRSFQGCPCILTFETSWFDLTLGSKVLAQEWRGTSKWPLLMQNMSNAHFFLNCGYPSIAIETGWKNVEQHHAFLSLYILYTCAYGGKSEYGETSCLSLALSLFPFLYLNIGISKN